VTTILRQGLPPVIRLLERGAGFERSDAPGSGARLALVSDNTRGVAPVIGGPSSRLRQAPGFLDLTARIQGTTSGSNTSTNMRAKGQGKLILRRAFKHLEQEVPESVARTIRSLRHPRAHWVRIPVGVLLVLGGIFSILPVLGLWMLPLGLLLIAHDVPHLREPVGRATIWLTRKWTELRQRLFRRSSER
jgi:hypothetical protein